MKDNTPEADAIPSKMNERNQSHQREAFKRYLVEKTALPEYTASQVERGVFNWSIAWADKKGVAKTWKNDGFASIYMSKARSLAFNMDPQSPVGNKNLVSRILEGELNPRDLAFMTPAQIFPEQWKRVIDEKIERDEYIYNEKPAAMTNQFKCGKCKNRECIYQERQMRSCDEPMSIFVYCLRCGNRWRIG